jgi:long-subunit acyl-CoA synthetase (AMP-forming)
MGAVVVPILPDFSATEVANVLEHSGVKAIFISAAQKQKIEGRKSEILQRGS